jgi:hypothetical protein
MKAAIDPQLNGREDSVWPNAGATHLTEINASTDERYRASSGQIGARGVPDIDLRDFRFSFP